LCISEQGGRRVLKAFSEPYKEIFVYRDSEPLQMPKWSTEILLIRHMVQSLLKLISY